jgi:hypothetical protein
MSAPASSVGSRAAQAGRPVVSDDVETLDPRARGFVHVLGVGNAMCLLAFTLISWGLVTIVPIGAAEPLEAAAFARLAQRLSSPGNPMHDWLTGQSFLRDPAVLTLAYAVPLALSCGLALVMLARLARAGADASTLRACYAWSVAFVIIALFAAPVLVQDFWLSAGWGRLVARGQNPYYTSLDPGVTTGLPLDYLGLLTTYGPLWTLLAGGIMKVSGDSALLAGILFKVVLAAAWVGSLVLLRTLLRDRGPHVQCVALIIAGWLPLGVVHAVADGHNDVVMAFLVMLWLFLLTRAKPMRASLVLAASVIIKYLSAPLFLLDFAHSLRDLQHGWKRYVPRAIAVAILGFGVTAIFFRDMAFFASTRHMSDWHFFTPRSAVAGLGRLVGVPPGLSGIGGIAVAGLAVLASVAFLCVGGLYVSRYWKNPSPATLRLAVLGVVGALLFGVVGHVWPWFLVWGLLSAALVPDSWLARWTVGTGIGACFVMLPWVAWPELDGIGLPGLLLCTFALAFSFLAPRAWFGEEAGVRP